MKEEQKGEILIYQSEEGKTKIEVRLQNENVWLSQQQMSELYQSSRTNVVEHIKHIYEEGELNENSTCRKFRQVQIEGTRNVERKIPFYNLDMIISLGYRIKSHIATRFRIWATQRLKEYIVKGFTMDDERLKQLGGGGYWYELLNRIRDIRSSEKVLYRQVLDLFETLYNPNFKPLEFDGFRTEAGLNAFTLSSQKWIETANARGMISKSGRYGGTFAHKDIAFKFANENMPQSERLVKLNQIAIRLLKIANC